MVVTEVPVEQLAAKLKSYLSEVTGFDIRTKPLQHVALPYFFSRQYALYDLWVGSAKFTAIFLQHSDEFRPAQFLKHLRQVPVIDPDDVCVVAQALPAYLRKRLIQQRIAFVVPYTQIYLPSVGMELRSRSDRELPTSVERYSPATQVVLIHGLLGRMSKPVTPLELSNLLGYSAMTMSRALNELEASEVGKIERVGRERLIFFPEDRKILWEKAFSRLRSPVSKNERVFLRDVQGGKLLPAGMTALSRYSMLAEPFHPEFAVSQALWKEMQMAGIETIPVEDEGSCLMQIWRYDPRILVVEERVDPFSLYLSLRDEADERVEMALEKMMEHYL